jgi:ABC transporter substrate binding protein (PQQ-dependent alcohol dehydrogenase system)
MRQRKSEQTRRGFLGTGMAAASGLLAGRAHAAGNAVRIGAVLPKGGDALPVAAANRGAAGEAARMGFVMAEEELALNAGLLGRDFQVLISSAPGAEAAHRAARRLAAVEGVSVLVGGFSREEAEALAEVADEFGILFMNIGCPSDALRGEGCRPLSFHVEASAAMYLDAIMGWFVRSQYRTWHLVHEDSEEGHALAARAGEALAQRHWGGREVGRTVVRPRAQDFQEATRAIKADGPDAVLVLTDWLAQLDFLAIYESANLTHPVVGFPEPSTQLRDFFASSRQIAPSAGAGHRAVLWEATLDAYGARELNARFGSRWGKPMDPPSWAAYQACKIAYEAALFGGTLEGVGLAEYLTSERAVFDVHKGIGVSFRPWDHQLRQSLYLVKIEPAGAPGHGLRHSLKRASLVGELPAIYMPGTDPVERLDQIGDIAPRAACG